MILDVGSGIEPQTLVWPKLHICVEAHGEYVSYLRERLAGSPRYLVMNSVWEKALGILPDKSVDIVFALDFIEHLSKEDGLAFVAEAERVARRQVVIFTPLGYFPQTYDDATAADRWGMHGGYWQTHRSGWVPEDFSEAWEIIGCRDYHTEDQHGASTDPIGCIWAIRTFGTASGFAEGSREMERRLRLRALVRRHVPAWCRSIVRSIRRRIS
ncbi:MAG TPA: methyltransferase domain-containing protein [Bryobacteraceae bacterium]|nr:methyltransferase domain-containing protein [Bryobacteraceae bacterium]